MLSIEVNHLSVYYESVCALKNIDFKINEKTFLGIIGPNGGGKTTLLKALIGLIKPRQGEIHIYDEGPIGYVPQFTAFDKHFPIHVQDVILMGTLNGKLKPFRKYSKEDILKAEEIMRNLNLLPFRMRQISKLSGGQLQKVLIARALISDPSILILDEPTANIDVDTKREIYDLLKRLNKDKTILIVSHDMEELFSYVNTIAYVNKTLDFYGNVQEFQKSAKAQDYSLVTKQTIKLHKRT